MMKTTICWARNGRRLRLGPTTSSFLVTTVRLRWSLSPFAFAALARDSHFYHIFTTSHDFTSWERCIMITDNKKWLICLVLSRDLLLFEGYHNLIKTW